MRKGGWIIEDGWIYILHGWLNEEFGLRIWDRLLYCG